MPWAVRSGIVPSTASWAAPLRRIAMGLQRFGTGRSAMFVKLGGRAADGTEHAREWHLLAHGDEGAYIPAMAAVRLARKLAAGEIEVRGAMPCVGLLTLDEYLGELKGLRIKVFQM